MRPKARFLGRLRRARVFGMVLQLQSHWRGVQERKRCSPLINEARARIAKRNAEAEEWMKLGNRTSGALEVLVGSTSLAEIMKACQTLNVASRLSEVCCEQFTSEQNAIPIIYSMMRSCNRSQPHLELLKVALQVLKNVCIYPRLAPAVAQAPEAVDVLTDLMQMFRDKPKTFCLAVRVLDKVCAQKSRSGQPKAEFVSADVARRWKGLLNILSRKSEVASKSGKGKDIERQVTMLRTMLGRIEGMN